MIKVNAISTWRVVEREQSEFVESSAERDESANDAAVSSDERDFRWATLALAAR